MDLQQNDCFAGDNDLNACGARRRQHSNEANKV
jgi:hypothetical protein